MSSDLFAGFEGASLPNCCECLSFQKLANALIILPFGSLVFCACLLVICKPPIEAFLAICTATFLEFCDP